MIIKKTYELEDLDCANCASKMEERIKKIDGVVSASVSFIMQNLTIEADESDLDKIMKQVVKVCRKVEPDCRIIL
jgi:copper chaperone CopZ